jgi:hypothetical protein
MDGLEMSSDILAARERATYAPLDNPDRRHEPDGVVPLPDKNPDKVKGLAGLPNSGIALPNPALVEDAPQKVERQSVLVEAQEVIHGARSRDYGAALDNHTATADMLSAYLRRKYGIAVSLTAEDVCLFNVLQKVARLANTPDHRDSLVDIAGYAGNVEMVQQERARRG